MAYTRVGSSAIMKIRMHLEEFLAALMGDHVGGYYTAREELLKKLGITEKEFGAIRKACSQGRFEIKGRRNRGESIFGGDASGP